MQIHAFLAGAIFVYGLVSIKCDLPSETGTVEEPFPKEKCESLLESCLCYDYEGVAGIICNNVTDFSKFSSLLATDAIFHRENMTYEITLHQLEHLPAQSLKGLIVFRLYLDDPNLSVIDKDAFEGVRRLRRFHVRRSSIKEVPDFRRINNSIRNINIDNSRLTALSGENLQGLSLVTALSFANNSIKYIDPNAFKGTEGVVILDLSYNFITSVPPRILDPMKKLKKLVLTHNRLLEVDHLFDVTHPRFIYLDFNNISNVDSVLVHNMTNVETITLASNPLRNLSYNSFNGKIPKVRFLYLDHCHLQKFDVKYFQSLEMLATLDLSHNEIEEISEQTINFGYKVVLRFIGNKIRSFKAEIAFTVKRIYLNENKLQALGQTLKFSQVVEASIARNQLQYLSAEDFIGVHGLVSLELQGNEIQWIDRSTFSNIRNDLMYLDLSANHITALNGSVQSLSRLKSLNVSDNRIQSFESGEFIGLNELLELYLQNNRIISLTGQLQQLNQLQYLVVTQNNINTISPEQVPHNLKYIYLADNPLQCDCQMLPFLRWLNTSDSRETDIDLCARVAETNYKRHHDPCPKMCYCTCTEDGDDYFMTVNCSSKNITVLPFFLTSNFVQMDNTSSSITFDFKRSLVFDLTTDSNFHISDRVRDINLKNNRLESFESAQLPMDLLHLHLAQNQLRTLPESMLYNLPTLRMVTLSENPWDCDCNAVGFKKWLVSKMDIIQDINETRCSVKNSGSQLDGRSIWTLTDLDICSTDIVTYLSVSFGVLSFLLLCLASKIMYTKYEMNIKMYLYSRGFTWVKARDIDYDKQYDAFLSFSHMDDAFVLNELISEIENKDPNIRLCIHHKHFRLGELIHDNIIRAVQNSKRTLLILSKHFLESEWCLMELRAAHVQSLEDKMHRIIVIKVGNLPKNIDPAIKVHLVRTAYLTWGEKYFWNKMLYVLPTSSTPRNVDVQEKDVSLKTVISPPNSKSI